MATGKYTWFLAMVVVTGFFSEGVSGRTTYYVTTILHSPYLVSKQPMKGYIPDLLDEISGILNVSLVLNHVADGRFGSKDSQGNWNGMMGDLVANRSDIAAAALTLTVERSKAVHFSHPFEEVGLRILVKKPSLDILSKLVNDDTGFFFRPLTSGVWISVIVSLVVVGIVIYVIGRYSPLQGDQTEGGVLWALCITCGIASLQGMRHLPVAFSARVLVSTALLFTLILVSMYSATLVSFVSTSSSSGNDLPFSTFRDLAMQTEYQYGTVGAGSTYQFFKQSNGDTERRIAAYLTANPANVMVSTTKGVDRVKQGKYAFIMESASAYYISATSCDLMVVGDSLRDRTYNFACRPNTNICDRLNIAILQLKMNGRMEELKSKWWSGKCGAYPRTQVGTSGGVADNSSNKGTPIDMKRFTIPLVLLVVGIVLSIVILLMEIYLPKVAGQLQSKRMTDDTQGFSGQMHA
ncbi:probable glutamate receptor [Mizuhopecten yessoensis]|uniref:Glutamate receptor n=1 Tax=Mizuhopecten yessoensis TaxID=6573 RepID=A0A210PRY9_MIZYE|nr:probable glutamate receptor [Mizuhopecten yessoensis]OWF39222.1 glutamate receptor [Mizuhopecten yessoensis]